MVFRLIIFFVGAMIFEFQKRRFAISLSKKILGLGAKQVFVFNNGRPLDIFDNFLAISDEKIMLATYYMPIQKKLSFLIRKPLFLKVIPIEHVVGHTKKGNDLALILQDEGKLVLKDIPNLEMIQIPHQPESSEYTIPIQ